MGQRLHSFSKYQVEYSTAEAFTNNYGRLLEIFTHYNLDTNPSLYEDPDEFEVDRNEFKAFLTSIEEDLHNPLSITLEEFEALQELYREADKKSGYIRLIWL